jgi:hypothetical protein
MRNGLVRLAACAAVLMCAGAANAADTLVYGFEADADGFAPNGGAFPVAQDTIGATELAHSLKVGEIPAGATFVGALTPNVPSALGDPPGVDFVLFDLTLPETYGGAFADMGVTVFGASQPDYPGGQLFGLQAQFKDFVSLGGLAAGTYHDLRIDLDRAHSHPLTFEADKSFNEIFGTVGSGENDVIPTGFQFFFSKSNDAPLTVYIDNVRVGQIPEPATFVMLGLGAAAMCALVRRRGQ